MIQGLGGVGSNVVIPAYDEAAVIERCLTALHTGLGGAGLEVIVSCNRCTDAAATVARQSRVLAFIGVLWGAGVYACSADGRARFSEFPDIVADDLFVDRLFRTDELEIVEATSNSVVAPQRIDPRLNALRRTKRGAAEREMSATVVPLPNDPPPPSSTAQEALRTAGGGPGVAFDPTVHLNLALAVCALVRLRPALQWERDDSSSNGATGSAGNGVT